MNRYHGLLGPQNGSDLPSALGLVSCGRARKHEADSRREFPGSRILADLCFEAGGMNSFDCLFLFFGQRAVERDAYVFSSASYEKCVRF